VSASRVMGSRSSSHRRSSTRHAHHAATPCTNASKTPTTTTKHDTRRISMRTSPTKRDHVRVVTGGSVPGGCFRYRPPPEVLAWSGNTHPAPA
jgi:hypothetical protein